MVTKLTAQFRMKHLVIIFENESDIEKLKNREEITGLLM